MRILLGESLPRDLVQLISAHNVSTVKTVVQIIGSTELLANHALDLTPGSVRLSAVATVAGAGHRQRWASRIYAVR